MNGKKFLDTNILVYCYTTTEPGKQQKARAAASQSNVIISLQVLREFINTLHKKFGLGWPEIRNVVEEVKRNFPIHINTEQTIERAGDIAERYGYSFYDSLIIAAALETGCETLYSEDLQNQQKIDNQLTIVNPLF